MLVSLVCDRTYYVWSLPEACCMQFSGAFSERATLVPIPNTKVKPLSVDDTLLGESRTVPEHCI